MQIFSYAGWGFGASNSHVVQGSTVLVNSYHVPGYVGSRHRAVRTEAVSWILHASWERQKKIRNMSVLSAG